MWPNHGRRVERGDVSVNFGKVRLGVGLTCQQFAKKQEPGVIWVYRVIYFNLAHLTLLKTFSGLHFGKIET